MMTKSDVVPWVGSWDRGGYYWRVGGRGAREKKPKNDETQLKPGV